MADGLKVRFWGVRGSISCSGAEYARYGGNTSCLEVTAAGRRLIFDAGTGIRTLGVELANGTPEEMAQNIRDELSRWAGVVKTAGIKLE